MLLLSVFQAKLSARRAKLSDDDVAELLGLVEPTSADLFLETTLANRLPKEKAGFDECLVALHKLRDAVGKLYDLRV